MSPESPSKINNKHEFFGAAVEENKRAQIGKQEVENFDFDDSQQFYDQESEILLATETNKFRPFTLKLYGKELYFYGKKDPERHEFMHTLVGTFVTAQDQVVTESETPVTLFPVKIALPPKYTRFVYFST